jgi:dihydrofolate reductase
VTFSWVSADGYFAGPDGNLDWVVPDQEQARAAAAGISDFDTVLFGRRTYELFERFWRHVVVDESGTIPDPHDAQRRSPEHGAIAVALNRMTKIVFSRSMKDATWSNARLVRELDPREIERMKAQHLRQRLDRVAAHTPRSDRRVSVRRLPGSPRKRPVAGPRRVDAAATRPPRGQNAPVRRRAPSVWALYQMSPCDTPLP